jgi:hypothetical protein
MFRMDENEFTDGKYFKYLCFSIHIFSDLAEANLYDIISEYQQISNYGQSDQIVDSSSN